jgi:hypothetical protein
MRIFKEPAWPNSLRTARRLHQIVALPAAMFPAKRVYKDKRPGELPGLD